MSSQAQTEGLDLPVEFITVYGNSHFSQLLRLSAGSVDPTSRPALPPCTHTSLPSRVLPICKIHDENFYLKNAKSLFHTFPSSPQGASSGYVEGIEAQLLFREK